MFDLFLVNVREAVRMLLFSNEGEIREKSIIIVICVVIMLLDSLYAGFFGDILTEENKTKTKKKIHIINFCALIIMILTMLL